MTQYAATVPIYLNFDSLILDTATKIALTKIVARGIVRDRTPDGMMLRRCAQVFTEDGVGSLVPPEIMSMQRAAQASGENVVYPLGLDLDLMHEWACLISEEDPVAFSRIPRMNLVNLHRVALAHWNDREIRKEKADAIALKMASLHLADCPVVHAYPDGWRWVHVTGTTALAAEGSVMGHCVGDSFYATLSGKHAILSLRDPEGMPHVTAQLAGDKFVIAQGHSNSEPVRYQDRIDELVFRCGAFLETHEKVGWADDELARR